MPKFYHSLHPWADWSLKCGRSTTEHCSHVTCIWSNAIPNDNLFDWTHKSPWLFVGHFNIWNTGSLQTIKLNLHLESTAEYSSGQSLYGQSSEAHDSMSTVMSWAQQTTTKVPPSCCPLVFQPPGMMSLGLFPSNITPYPQLLWHIIYLFRAFTAFLAASSRSSAVMMVIPLSWPIPPKHITHIC